jgi:hypothetical protein
MMHGTQGTGSRCFQGGVGNGGWAFALDVAVAAGWAPGRDEYRAVYDP